jgi:FtsZ-binding cell division protein ZapB
LPAQGGLALNIPLLESRVTSLESLMADLIGVVENTSRTVAQLTLEMAEFKDEMSDFKDEMRDFKDEMKDFKDEMKDFKDEMKDFKDRMLKFQEDNEKDRRAFNKQLGENSNKQGRMVEDIVEPSMDRIFKELLGLSPDVEPSGGMRVKIPHPRTGQMNEFDVIRTYGNYLLLTETKSTLRPYDVDDVLIKINEIREYFPEYRERKMMASVASLNVDESLVTYASRKGIIVLAVGDHLMDIMNPPGFTPTEF